MTTPNAGRRTLLKQFAAVTALTPLSSLAQGIPAEQASKPAQQSAAKSALKGNINHSVSRWTYSDLSLDELCLLVKSLGFNAIDLVGPAEWPILKEHGVISSMCNGAELNLEDGWSDSRFHAELIPRYLRHIELVAAAGYKNLICFTGNARGMSPEQALENAAVGLAQILPHAEKHGVIIQLELFNSKVDHPDYVADNTPWSIALCQRLNSPHFKLLYDIYHMQIMEGDIIRTISQHHHYFGHYHTAGVPGRHEIDDSQELNYGAIAKAIKATGFQGYLAQEFIPTPDTKAGRVQSLAQAIQICDV